MFSIDPADELNRDLFSFGTFGRFAAMIRSKSCSESTQLLQTHLV